MAKSHCVSFLIALSVALWLAGPARAASFQALGGGSTTAYAACVSGDGTVVAGFSSDGSAGYRWTEAGGVETLGFQPADVSLDGSVIVGTRGFGEAVRWTAATGAVGLGDLTPGDGSIYSFGLGVSADGSSVVGATADEPFAWTLSGGMFASATNAPPDATNGFNSGISADGSVTAGGYSTQMPVPSTEWPRTSSASHCCRVRQAFRRTAT